jgi:hypothetical protein
MPNNTQQLEGYRARLQSELARALGATPIRADLVERLVREVRETQQQAAAEARQQAS